MQETENLATGRAVILEIVRAMRENLEPLMFSTVAPSRFYVYLHPNDHKRLEGIFPLVVEEARRALDDEVAHSKQRSNTKLKKLLTTVLNPGSDEQASAPIEAPAGGWEILFEPDLDGEMQPGDIAVASELVLPAPTELAGSMTRRVTTMLSAGKTSRREQVVPTPAVEPKPAPQPAPSAADGTLFATLTYEDQQGPHRFAMVRNEVVIGRGGVGYWVDVKVQTSPDVSREHVRLRRDPDTDQFFLKDLSSLGTTIDGQPVASSVEVVEGRKRDTGIEVPLPRHARIGLADTVFVQFDAEERS